MIHVTQWVGFLTGVPCLLIGIGFFVFITANLISALLSPYGFGDDGQHWWLLLVYVFGLISLTFLVFGGLSFTSGLLAPEHPVEAGLLQMGIACLLIAARKLYWPDRFPFLSVAAFYAASGLIGIIAGL